MATARLGWVITSCLASYFSSGCSFGTITEIRDVERAAVRTRRANGEDFSGIRTHCTSSPTAPIIDTVGASVIGLNTLMVAATPDNSLERAVGGHTATLALLGTLVTVTYAASAVYGYGATADCRGFKRLLESSEKVQALESQRELERLRLRLEKLERERRGAQATPNDDLPFPPHGQSTTSTVYTSSVSSPSSTTR